MGVQSARDAPQKVLQGLNARLAEQYTGRIVWAQVVDLPRESRPAVMRGSSSPTVRPSVVLTACRMVACIHVALSTAGMAAQAGACASALAAAAASREPAGQRMGTMLFTRCKKAG